MPFYNCQLGGKPVQPEDLHVHARIYLLIDANVCEDVRIQRKQQLAKSRGVATSDRTFALAINAAKASSLAAVTQQRGPPIYP